MNAIEVRRATVVDARRMAELHAARITEGFLPTLGVAFLSRLYRRVVKSHDAFASVAVSSSGEVVGFCATAVDVGRLYKRFLVRDGLIAGCLAAPRIVRSWRRVLETMRYPAHASELPPAEVLAVAVDDRVAGRGVGRALVAAAVREIDHRSVGAVKVVAGMHNDAALALYRACGFVLVETMEVHDGVTSAVLVWQAPHLHVVPKDPSA